MLKRGSYVTRSGFSATVAQILCVGGKWIARGAVQLNDGALYLNIWYIDGKSKIGYSEIDIING